MDSRRHFQTDLAEYLRCSVQTVMRLIAEIERVIGANLVTALEKLVRAADEDRVCLVLYKALKNDRDKEHKFACGGLVCMNNAIYALGVSLTDDFREKRFLISLAVHRMKDVTVTDKKWHVEIPEDELGMFGLPWQSREVFAFIFMANQWWNMCAREYGLIASIWKCSQMAVLCWKWFPEASRK